MQPTNFQNMIDIGANLAASDFNADLDEVLQNGFAAGLDKIIITGSCFDSIARAKNIVLDYAQYKNHLFYTAGVHPHHSDKWQADSAKFIEKYAKDSFCVATGEMGLDYFRNFVDRDIQLDSFKNQLELAMDIGKPIFIHERDAGEDMLSILKQRLAYLPKVVIHCFTGELAILTKYLELGFYIGITGWICDSKRGAHLEEAVKIIPTDKLMIETDAPYLMPKNIKPRPKTRRNEPKYLPYVAEKIANILQSDPQTLIDQTSLNATNFFELDKF